MCPEGVARNCTIVCSSFQNPHIHPPGGALHILTGMCEYGLSKQTHIEGVS